jgi:hypothetical protein
MHTRSFISDIVFALTAVMLTGCGSSDEPSRAVTRLSLVVHSAEWEADRSLVVVGENASAEIETETDEGCLSDVPCPISADVELRSSDPDVLSPLQQRVRAPANVALVAHAPGTATVTVTTDGLTESRRVDVVTDPLPLDAIQVTLLSAWNDLPVQYDASNSLTWVEVPAGQYGALEIVSLRSGAEVFGIPISISSYPYVIAQATTGCRPVRVDPQCVHVGDAWIWGVTPGDAQITVSGRNISTSFTAHVP